MEDILFGGALLLVIGLVLFDPFHQLGTPKDGREEQFDEWIRTLDEDVIQGEYGYEKGEFTVSPESWRPLFDRGLTPAQAFQRALEAHRES